MASTYVRPTDTSFVEVEFPRPGIAIVTMRGEHDLNSATQLADALADAARRPDVLVDLGECTFIDSTVIKLLIGTRRGLDERGGRLELVIPQGAAAIRRIVELTKLDSILSISESRSRGLDRLRRGAHSINIRDRRAHFGDPEAYAPECECGWQGETHTGDRTAARAARREGAIHVERQRIAHRTNHSA